MILFINIVIILSSCNINKDMDRVARTLGEGAAEATLDFTVDLMLSEDVASIRQIFKEFEREFNRKDITSVGQHLSDNFLQGSIDKDNFLELIKKIFVQYEIINLTIEEIKTSIDKDIQIEGASETKEIMIEFTSYWNFKGKKIDNNSVVKLKKKEEFILKCEGDKWYIISAPDMSLILSLAES